jgi:hypothetical protein
MHRKLFKGGAKAYTELWTRRLHEAKAAGIEVGVIAVLHQASLEAGPESFYRYFTEELGLDNFQVNTPFPGGPASQIEGGFQLDLDELARFLGELFDIRMEKGYHSGVALGPFDLQFRFVIEQTIKYIRGIPHCRIDELGIERGVLVRDMGIGGHPRIIAVARVDLSIGVAVAASATALPSEEDVVPSPQCSAKEFLAPK